MGFWTPGPGITGLGAQLNDFKLLQQILGIAAQRQCTLVSFDPFLDNIEACTYQYYSLSEASYQHLEITYLILGFLFKRLIYVTIIGIYGNMIMFPCFGGLTKFLNKNPGLLPLALLHKILSGHSWRSENTGAAAGYGLPHHQYKGPKIYKMAVGYKKEQCSQLVKVRHELIKPFALHVTVCRMQTDQILVDRPSWNVFKDPAPCRRKPWVLPPPCNSLYSGHIKGCKGCIESYLLMNII